MNNRNFNWLPLILFVIGSCQSIASVADNWHRWRGPEHNGVSRTAKPPIEWNENKNVQWKTAIPGHGLSTPIVWGDKVFLLSAINTGRVDPALPKPEDQPKRVFGITFPNTTYAFLVLCLDRNTGQEIWRHEPAHLIPHEGHHKDNNFASASPVTDGQRLFCWFGSSGLFCYDLDGKLLWERQLGKVRMGASLGEGASPALFDGKLVLVRDHSRQSYIETLEARTGKTLWRKNRDEPNTWATPAIVKHSGRTQVIVPGSNRIRSYDLNNGDIIWQCGGLTGNPIPSPLVHGDTVICMTGYKGHRAMAIKLDSLGDVTGSDKVVWSHDRGTPYIPSPLLYDDLIWFNQSNQSMWTCIDARTGEVRLDRERLPGVFNIYSAPVGADGRIYVTARNGITLVLQRDQQLKVLARNRLDDSINASPALVGDQLFLRGRTFLYCLSHQGGDRKPKLVTLAGVDVAPPTEAEPVVSGAVRFEGQPPQRRSLNMTPESRKLYDRPPLDEKVLTGENGGLANVFVYAKRGVERKKYPLPDQSALLDQRKSMFRPRIQGVRVGQKFIIRNSDPYIHNTRSLSLRNRMFNVGQPPKSADRERVFTRAEGPIRLGCDFHKWMTAFIFVLDHPFFAVTDENGNFQIKGLPPGEYVFEAWHEEFGDQRVTLKVDGSAKLDFSYQPGDK